MSDMIEKAKNEIRIYERCSKDTCEKLVAEIERLTGLKDDGTVPPEPGDLEELLLFAFAAGGGYDHPLNMTDADRQRFKDTRRVPVSTHQRVTASLARESLWRFWNHKALELAHMLSEARSAAEKERLRFEGDLDKWMKLLGTGITGYQPEAYALMDSAVEELVKLRASVVP